jgi:hypothetical protein
VWFGFGLPRAASATPATHGEKEFELTVAGNEATYYGRVLLSTVECCLLHLEQLRLRCPVREILQGAASPCHSCPTVRRGDGVLRRGPSLDRSDSHSRSSLLLILGCAQPTQDHAARKQAARASKSSSTQLVECCAWDRWPPRFLTHDRDSRYCAIFEHRLRHLGIAQVRTPFRAPENQCEPSISNTCSPSPGPFASCHVVVCHRFQLLASAWISWSTCAP